MTRSGQSALVEAIADAVRGGDDRTVRRLLARFAEEATIDDLYALRDALGSRHHRGQQMELQ